MFVLWTLLAIPSALLLIFFLDGLLSRNETVVRSIYDASLYLAGLPLLMLPTLLACSWILGFAIFRVKGVKKPS